MQTAFPPIDTRAIPPAADAGLASLACERWLDRIRQGGTPRLRRFAAELAADPGGRALLNAIFGNSPFLTHCLHTEPETARLFLAHGPDHVFGELLVETGILDDPTETDKLMQRLRIARRRVALLVALADLSGRWPLERVVEALSAFADAAIGAAARHLLRRAANGGDIAPADPAAPERSGGLMILGMGKLGAQELNYSSDIDLIVLYDRERIDYRGRRTVQDFFVRITRDLVRILQNRTPEGYVFRTDLRLRPDPASTPLAMSVSAAEAYYESMGQNWERAAMIKARAVAGDIEAGQRFLRHLRPFIWRRNLDFAAIQDIHSIKRQIHAVKGFRHVAVGGHDIKVGRGGIREIEFFAQTQQLIWGGRSPELRAAGTCTAIRALAAAGRVAPAVAEEMIAAYRHLRRVEHRLQMIDDHQTQTLPPGGPALDRVARFVGHASTEAFAEELLGHLNRVENNYAELFEEAPSLGGPGNLVFTGAENDPETVRTLEGMGFSSAPSICAVIRSWHFGRYRATRSTRARELLTELMPRLLESLSRTVNPDAAFARFDEFLSGLPAGVQFLSLLYANPDLLDLIAEIMGSAPRLARHLSRNADLLDAVLSRGFFDALPPAPELAEDLGRTLAQATDFQDLLDLSRRWSKDRQFQVGARILRNISDADASGADLSDVADTAIRGLMPHVEAEFVAKHGRLPGAGLAGVALGKLGGREMTVSSDLDLIFLYDVPDELARRSTDSLGPTQWDALSSDGRKPLAPIHYFARLSQRLINAVTALTAEGRLYEVDMRLRPSGTSGPIASTLSGFRRYQDSEAWTWEHMALTRARVIIGAPEFMRKIDETLRDVLTRPRDPARLAVDVADMRDRIQQQTATDRIWDVKHVRGGLVDAEFIAQFLQLRHAAAQPGVLRTNTAEALAALARAGFLERPLADALIDAVRLWRRIQGMLRLTVGRQFDEAALPDGLQRSLAQAGGAADFFQLKEQMLAAASTVRSAYEEIVAAPARAAGWAPRRHMGERSAGNELEAG